MSFTNLFINSSFLVYFFYFFVVVILGSLLVDGIWITTTESDSWKG